MKIAFLLTVTAVVSLALWYRHRLKQVMIRLDRMLDQAMKGEFTEDRFDESMLSAVEAKLSQYLAASTVSARNLQREKDAIKSLIADISHQTKLPIANVLLYTQLLAEQELSPESRACVTALEAQASKLQVLIDALVKTSRLESGIIALTPSTGHLGPVVRSAAEQAAPRAVEKGVHLILEPDDSDAVFDPKWTEEAVFNLLDNAVKYTPAGGTVTAKIHTYPLFSCVTVSDTGPGIPESEQARIFQRFYRGQQHLEQEGVGIGLYLVRQIAEGQGGYVKVSSPEDGGAVFSLFLPRN